MITTKPVAISTTFEAKCNLRPPLGPTDEPTSYPLRAITAAPTHLPSASPTNPLLSPAIDPTAVPTIKSKNELLAKPLFTTRSTTNPPLNTMSSTIQVMDEYNNVKTTDESDFDDLVTEVESYDNAVLIASIGVTLLGMVQLVIFIYFVSGSIQRTESIVEGMQMKKSIESIPQNTGINAFKIYENKHAKISPQPHALSKQDGGVTEMRLTEYVNQEIVIE